MKDSKSMVSKTIPTAIKSVLGPKYHSLPRITTEMQKEVSNLKVGMIQAFGCIDGTHIPLNCPLVNSQDFLNYNHYFLLNIQDICNRNGYFMNVECKWPGSVHGAKDF